jgi:signal transduction histidine kinase
LETPHDDLITVPVQSLFEDPAWTTVIEKLLQEDSQPGDTATVSLSRGERMIRAELTRLPLNQNWPGRLMALFYLAKGTSVQDTMVGSLIQELRTPMTSITGYTDLLLGEKLGILGESQRRLLLRVEANIERMERLLDDLIKATDIDIGQMALVPQPVAMDDIIEKALETLSARFDEKDLRVELEVPSDLPPAHADPDSAHQIVLNLLSNAALSSEPGTKVRVAARVEGEPEELEELPPYLVISVTDTGGGVAPEDRRRVFRRFYRADTPLIPGIGDKGVGLSVAKALVEANDGRIWVESEMGSGSTFGFMLPISRPDAASGAAHG